MRLTLVGVLGIVSGWMALSVAQLTSLLPADQHRFAVLVGRA